MTHVRHVPPPHDSAHSTLIGHTVVFSNHSPVDGHARLPKRLLEIVATRDPPPADKTCVLTSVERPEIKNTAWISTTEEGTPPPPGCLCFKENTHTLS